MPERDWKSKSLILQVRSLFRASNIFILQDTKVGHLRNVFGLCQHLLCRCNESWEPNVLSLSLCNADSKGGQGCSSLQLNKCSALPSLIRGQMLKAHPAALQTQDRRLHNVPAGGVSSHFPINVLGVPVTFDRQLVWTLQLPAPQMNLCLVQG